MFFLVSLIERKICRQPANTYRSAYLPQMGKARTQVPVDRNCDSHPAALPPVEAVMRSACMDLTRAQIDAFMIASDLNPGKYERIMRVLLTPFGAAISLLRSNSLAYAECQSNIINHNKRVLGYKHDFLCFKCDSDFF